MAPSKVIAEGYATTEIELKSGDVIAGWIEREDDQVVVLRPVSAVEAPVIVHKTEIRSRALSKLSNMPAGIAIPWSRRKFSIC